MSPSAAPPIWRASAAERRLPTKGEDRDLRPADKSKRRNVMMRTAVLAGVGILTGVVTLKPAPARAQEAPGKGITIYMQMGGNAGDGSTLARTNGAEAAAKALQVDKLNEQYAG